MSGERCPICTNYVTGDQRFTRLGVGQLAHDDCLLGLAQETDQQQAERIKAAVEALNVALASACAGGLAVEIEARTVRTFNGVNDVRVVARVNRPVL